MTDLPDVPGVPEVWGAPEVWGVPEPRDGSWPVASSPPTCVVLSLDPHPDTVCGRVGYPDDEGWPFHGWMELTSHLDRLRPRPEAE